MGCMEADQSLLLLLLLLLSVAGCEQCVSSSALEASVFPCCRPVALGLLPRKESNRVSYDTLALIGGGGGALGEQAPSTSPQADPSVTVS